MTLIEREGRSRRHLDRLRSEMRVEIAGRAYDALDWSAGGFAIPGAGAWRRGQRVAARLLFPVNGQLWGLDVTAEVAHADSARTGFALVDLRPDQIEGLQRLRLACISGHIMSLDAMLAGDEPPRAPQEPVPQPPARRRRWLGLAALLALGPAVLAAGLTMLHDRLLTLRAPHAAVTVPVLRVRMPADGLVRSLAVAPGAPAASGTVLFDLADDALLAEIDLAEAELGRHTAALEAMRRRHAELAVFFADYVDLAAAAVRRSQAAEAQARQSLDLAERDFARIADLHATGHVAQARMDETQARLAAARRGHLASIADLDQARANLRMAQGGRYFTGSRVEGGEPARLAEDIRRAEREHALQSLRLATLMDRRAGLAVTSPCDCVVVAVAAQPGEWLRAASDVYLLRPAEAAPTITAKLPHDKARLLRLDDAAVLRLPQQSQPLRGRVTAVSHTAPGGGLGLPARLDEDAAFATVTIALPPGTEPPPGTPAAVAFPLHWRIGLAEWMGLAPR